MSYYRHVIQCPHTHTHTHTSLPFKCVLLKSSIKRHYGFYYDEFLNDKTEEEVKV